MKASTHRARPRLIVRPLDHMRRFVSHVLTKNGADKPPECLEKEDKKPPSRTYLCCLHLLVRDIDLAFASRAPRVASLAGQGYPRQLLDGSA